MITQVKDHISLLELMMKDNRAGSALYQATPFWQPYEKVFLPELYRQGLHNFRSRKNSILASFGATDIFDGIEIDIRSHFLFRRIPSRMVNGINGFLNRHVPIRRGAADFIHLASLYYELAKMRGRETGAKLIENLT